MSISKIKKQVDTFDKLDKIISTSKIKVLNQMSQIKKEASHNYVTALLSKKIFEFAQKKHHFESEIYKNSFQTQRDINVVFLEEKQTLSNSYERTISAFLKNRREEDFSIIVCDGEIKDSRLESFRVISFEQLMSISYELSERYISRKFERIKIFSSLNKDERGISILPICELEEQEDDIFSSTINNKTTFKPSLDYVIERSYFDYLGGLMKYFYIQSKYTNLKNTLLKHETSLDHIQEKLDVLKMQINKMRQSKLTEEISMAFQGGEND